MTRRRRGVPPGNLPRGRGMNPADVDARLARRKREPECDGPGVARCEEEDDRD